MPRRYQPHPSLTTRAQILRLPATREEVIAVSRTGTSQEIRDRLRVIFPGASASTRNALATYGMAAASAAAAARRAGGFTYLSPGGATRTPGLASQVEYAVYVNLNMANNVVRRELVIVSAAAPLQKVALYELIREGIAGEVTTVEFATGAIGAAPAVESVSDFSILEVVGR